MDDKRSTAIRRASEYITSQAYQHGELLRAECLSGDTENLWEIEFAYAGKNARVETSDPPSISISVNLFTGKTRINELM